MKYELTTLLGLAKAAKGKKLKIRGEQDAVVYAQAMRPSTTESLILRLMRAENDKLRLMRLLQVPDTEDMTGINTAAQVLLDLMIKANNAQSQVTKVESTPSSTQSTPPSWDGDYVAE